jgi:hypothetical protein
MELIYLLEEIFGKIVFSIGEYKFEGFRPTRYMDLPWGNRKEMNDYMTGLEKENTPYSYKKFIYWEEQRQYQKIHMLFSRSFLCLVTGVILLIISAILLIFDYKIASITVLTGSIIIFLLSLFLKVYVKKYYTSASLGKLLYNYFETWPD